MIWFGVGVCCCVSDWFGERCLCSVSFDWCWFVVVLVCDDGVCCVRVLWCVM